MIRILKNTTAFIMVFVMSAMSTFASVKAEETPNVMAEIESDATVELKNIISVEDFQNMKNETIKARTTNESAYVVGHSSFIPYAQSEFTQQNGCGPTAIANILSYFQGARGVSLFSGDIITQNIYNQICTDVQWSSSGTSMVNAANGLTTFCNRAGKTCVIDDYWLDLWSDVTRDVTANKPILLNDVTQRHLMVIFGYEIIDNVKYLYVCTGISSSSTPLFGYLEWGTDTINMRSVNIY